MDETQAPSAVAEDSGARDEGYSSVAEAVAELDRRDKARAAEKKAAKAAATDADAGDDATEEVQQDEDEPPKKKAKKADPEEDSADEADDDAEDDGEDADESDDDADEEDDAEDDKPAKKEAKKEPEPPAKVRLKIDGKDIEATPDEVAQFVSEAKTERERTAQARTQLQQQAEQLARQGQMLAQMAQAMIGDEPDIRLAQSDPGAYIAQQALYRQRHQALQALQGQHTQAAQAAQQHQEQARQEFIARERSALLKAIPELADPAALSSFQGRIAKVAQHYGLTPQDLASAFDHRSYLMLRDLARFHDQQKERDQVRSKLAKAPPLKVPAQRAADSVGNTEDARAKAAKARFLKSAKSMKDVRRYVAESSR
jgi:hypothetical protein